MDDLERAQESLGRSIGRARAGEDPELAGTVREKGEQMVGLLFGLLRTSRAYAPDNPALNQPVAELTAAIARLVQLLGALHLVTLEEQVYLNEIRIRTPQLGRDGRSLASELSGHEAGGLTFTSAPSEAQVRALLISLNAKPAADRPRAALRRALLAKGVDNVEPALLHRFRIAGEAAGTPEERLDPQGLVTRGVDLVNDAWDGIADGRRMNILPLRRVVTDLLELQPGHDDLWGDPPEASAHGLHSFRVCQYVLLLAEGVQLSVALKQDLGVAALLHDIGAARAGGGDPHVRAGSLALLQQPGFHEGKVRRVLAVYDHHRQIVETVGGRSTLFGRILHIADDYDGLVRSGVSPARAIGSISGGAGIRYDPVMFQAFINRMGRYPPGTSLKLADGRTVRTTSVVRSPETFALPRAVTLSEPPEVIDLAQGASIAAVL
jgi:hypothetical protein